ncbi:C-5 cytosine-specific DNA methylase [Teladorsagia circumcincta]|uniref:tRNA (cytosine(38)-C(5))-methyltransferase n=1 Tax=Teladorsagia circumcincta TaxID=45464 RepID=A0A2G9UEW8_TELCI|nr:C-5 cytosine-specific DNA methylase [Teladorsagia circumcincta]
MSKINAVEFYSGIGGVHYALREAHPNSHVVAAYDINTTANKIYAYNFPETALCQNNIQAISIRHLEKLDAQLWTMSPPCQPFTKKGSQQGIDDHRCDSFMALLEKLKQMRNRPRFIFLENVLGFETSSVHKELISTLTELQYGFQEFILSPLQFGVPNSRPRYYLLACSDWHMTVDGEISTTLESCNPSEPKAISFFLEELPFDKHLYLSMSNLMKYGLAVDVVSLHSTRSACFTKSYGSYIAGCGSYFCSRPEFVDGNRLTAEALADEEVLYDVVRVFSPREVANLMCFPMEFTSPADATDKQLYRCLGNSVNVRVVAALLSKLLHN